MKERPILFSSAMVRAIIAGNKTVTRRIVKPQPPCACRYAINGAQSAALCFADELGSDGNLVCVPPTPRSKDHRLPCPYGAPGDRLWVKETWRPNCVAGAGVHVISYTADGENRTFHPAEIGDAWTMPKAAVRGNVSPLFLPRWASRVLLEVVGVRVERLQDITEEDACAEGFRGAEHDHFDGERFYRAEEGSALVSFRCLWHQLNGDRSPWSNNPWVWRVEFRRVQP